MTPRALIVTLTTLLTTATFVGLCQEQRPLRVAVSSFPPLVSESNGRYAGFDIELWDAIAERVGVEHEYETIPFHTIFERLEQGEADVAIAGVTITEERERRVDFSHQYLESGLRIMTQPQRQGSSILAAIKTVFTGDRMMMIAYLTGFIILCGHILWFSERGEDAISDHYGKGIFEAFWCVMATMTTVGYGDIAPRKWVGRLAASGVMITGIALFSIVLAQLSAGLTAQTLESGIRSPDDLRGRRVGTVEGSTSETFLATTGAVVVALPRLEDAHARLVAGSVEAVVFDSPPLMHFAQTDARAELAGELFEFQYYGIAFPQGSALREEVNRALLALRRDGVYDRLYEKWFGERR